MDKKDLKIIFFGTPDFAVESLSKLVDNGFNVSAVVTMPDKQAGRGRKVAASPVKEYAVSKDIPVLQPANLKDPAFISELQGIGADLFIVIAFRMLPQAVWQMPRLGTFNLHASLLPKYRGAAPINRAIMNGEKETGVTTFFLKHEIDTGDIIDMEKVEIGPEEDAGSLHDRLMELGGEMVLKTVNDILAGNVTTKPQPEGEHVAAPKIFKDTCKIDWNLPAENIHNHVRGLSPYPAAWSEIILKNNPQPQTIKVFKTRITDKPTGETPIGTPCIEKHSLYVATSDNWLEIMELQPAGKKRMETSAFLLGYNPERFL